MPAKAPIYLKNAGGKNVAGNKGSKKLREILSTDMISPPLGDFRHTAHVGRGGTDDMFGDTSFLQNDSNLKIDDGNMAKGDTENSNGARKGFSLGSGSRTLDRVKKDRSKKHGSNDGDASFSPNLQSAFSLPQLNASALAVEQNANGGAQSSQGDSNQGVGCSKSEEDLKTASQSDFKTPAGSCEGPPKPRRILASSSSKGRENGGSENNHDSMPKNSVTQKHLATERSLESPPDDDYWKFDIDLGPSLMDEIMGAIGSVRPAQ